MSASSIASPSESDHCHFVPCGPDTIASRHPIVILKPKSFLRLSVSALILPSPLPLALVMSSLLMPTLRVLAVTLVMLRRAS